MIKRNSYILHAACAVMMLAACTGNGDKGSKAPIVMGDSATIITETDSHFLQDNVADLHPNIPTKTRRDEDDAAPAKPDSTPVAQVNASAAPAAVLPAPGNGLTIPFKEASVTIPGIAVKSYRNQDPTKGNGVSYQLVSGNITTSHIVINSGTVLKVSQRYQSQLIVNGDDASLQLDNLTATTNWAPLAGSKNSYPITGLEIARLTAPEFNANSLRNAITRAARRKHVSRKREQEYQAEVRNVRRAGQRPLSVGLRSVMWKIDGKDASGKLFSKQIRVDLP